ncbi:MAG: hypothetical protein IJ241_04070 [Clostridia bacterium]|nr:hypothetical protein [Clostridia bacterium]MBQ8925838.1 hypothetical protein [Clostridia bacterium]
MNKKILSVLLALTLAVAAVIAAACTTEESELNTVTAAADDFQYTLQTGKLEYDANALSPDKPFDVTLSIEYTGDQDTIDVWCVDDLGSISMEDENGQALLSDEYHSRATSRVTLKKGEPYVIRWTGADEYKEYGGIPAGDYKVVAYLNFSTDQNYDSIQENTLDLSMTVK